MNRVAQLEDMLLLVAKALGAELTRQLLERSDFDYAVEAAARNSQERESIIFRRLEALVALARV